MRAEKIQLVKDIGELLNSSRYAYFISYKGLKVKELSQLRTELAEVGARCHVLKNSLIRKAAELHGRNAPLNGAALVGDTAMISGEGDPGAAAKLIGEFAKKNSLVSSKSGLLDGAPLSAADVEMIASLPPREVLLSQLLGVLQAPSRNLATVLNMKLTSIVNVLNAYKNKREEA